MTPPLDLMIAGPPERVMRAFLDRWRTSGSWDLLELADVPAESPTADALAAACRGTGLQLAAEPSKTTYVAPVETSWDAFLASRSRNFKQNIRKGRRRCERIGRTWFARFPGGSLTLGRAIDMTLHVLDRSWKAASGDRERWVAFFGALMSELAARDRLVVWFLLINDVPIAYLLLIDYRDALHAFHAALDAAYQPVSPGLLVMSEAMREAHERPRQRLELWGDAEYFHPWTSSTRTFRTLRLVNASPSSRLKARLYRWARRRRRADAGRRARG